MGVTVLLGFFFFILLLGVANGGTKQGDINSQTRKKWGKKARIGVERGGMVGGKKKTILGFFWSFRLHDTERRIFKLQLLITNAEDKKTSSASGGKGGKLSISRDPQPKRARGRI